MDQFEGGTPLLLEPDEQDELLRLVGKIAELKSGIDKPKGAIDV